MVKVSLFVGDQGGTTYDGTDESLKNDDTGLWLTNGTALLLLGPTGLAGRISAGAALYLGDGAAASVDEVALEINQRPDEVDEEFQVDDEVYTLELPAGQYLKVTATGLRVTIAGQQLTADLTIEKINRTSPTAVNTLTIAFANVSLRLGPVGNPVVVVSNGEGSFTIATGGGIVGEMSVDLALNVPGATLSGTFSLQLNTTGAEVDGIAVGVKVTGEDVVLGIAGQRLTGSFTVEQNPTTKEVGLALDMLLELGNGTETFLSVGIDGALLITPQGMALDVTGTVELGEALETRLDGKLVLDNL